jgi:hypothetical protein
MPKKPINISTYTLSAPKVFIKNTKSNQFPSSLDLLGPLENPPAKYLVICYIAIENGLRNS